MDEKVPDFLTRAFFQNCNKQIEDFNQVLLHLQQYTLCNVLLVPKKYEERIVRELELLNDDFNTPIAYEINDVDNGNISVSLFNFGVIQKENWLNEMEVKK